MDLNKIKNKSDNFYSKALFFIGWGIIVLGAIGSMILGSAYADYYSEFNFTVFFICILSTAMSGFLVLGVAEIISILNDNRRLLATMTQNNETPTGSSNSIVNSIAEELPEI